MFACLRDENCRSVGKAGCLRFSMLPGARVKNSSACLIGGSFPGRSSSLYFASGFKPGATVMVHSSFSHVRRRVPGLSPKGLIALLQEQLGPEGTLLMPTFPFQGSQGEYAEKNPRFDVQRTPSKVGVLTEVFRQMEGVVRSKHPTHPVAAWGRNASEIVSTHHLGPTFGVTSPFYRLREFEGIVVGLGTSMVMPSRSATSSKNCTLDCANTILRNTSPDNNRG